MAGSPSRPAPITAPPTPASAEKAPHWAWFGGGAALVAIPVLIYSLFFAPAPAVHVTTPPPRPTAPPVAVHVVGEVRSPGVYHLAASARVEDALQMAGGATDDGDPHQVNLAARVTDGQRIAIPRRIGASAHSGASTPGSASSGTTGLASSASPILINLNTASFAELDTLPGVGPVTAQKILDFRQQQRFSSVEQLLESKIVNSATYERVKVLVTVD